MEKIGFVNIIKPTNMTSSDVVIKIKKILNTKRVGHLGTLDPAASGVLPIAVGKATKFFDYFLKKDKVYRAVVEFGVETDTLDSFGNITKTDNTVNITEDKLLNIIPEFIGEIMQTPPKFSAKKVGGKKAYELVRENANFELKPKKLTVFDIKLVKKCEKNRFLFEVHCEAGTYIRSLFNDIANKLNTVATTSVIIRTKSGLFDLNSALTLEEFDQQKNLILIENVFKNHQVINVDGLIAKKILNGVKVEASDFKQKLDNEFLIKFEDKLVGMYCLKNGVVQPLVFIY